MDIIVSGAGGFLGRNFIDAALKVDGCRIIALTSQIDYFQKAYDTTDGRLRVVFSNDFYSIDWENIDILLNCAFPRDVDGVNMARGLSYLKDLFSIAAEGNVSSVINISSQSVYSQMRDSAANEDTEINLETKYAIGKYSSELFLSSICKDIPHVNLRLASLIGVGFNQRVVNKLVASAINGNNLHIVGGKQKFGFLDIRDAVGALLAVVKEVHPYKREIYNLGTNESVTLEDIAKMVCELSEKYCDNVVSYDIEQADIIQNSSMACEKFFEDFHWTPMYSVKDTIISLYENPESL